MKYKIIRKFPYSPEAGSIGIQISNTDIEFKDLNVIHRYGIKEVESNPEFFAPYLFTTEDGVDIYKGDDFYWYRTHEPSVSLDTKGHYGLYRGNVENRVISNAYKFFSTEKAVQNYIDEQNRPKFEKGEWLYVKGKSGWKSLLRFDSYNIPDVDYFSVSEQYTIYSTGLVEISEYSNTWPIKTSVSTISKATPSQIEEILSKVAIHKGFKEGVEYKSAFSGDTFTVPFVDFQWDGEGLCTKGENLNGFIYNKGKWAEIIEDVPEYVKCTKSASTTYLENKIYKVNKEGFLKNYVIGEDNRILSLYNRFLKYPNVLSSHFEFSTKEAYDAQFQTKELTITLDGDVVNTSHWGNNVKITYK